jgi:hypothetical protein
MGHSKKITGRRAHTVARDGQALKRPECRAAGAYALRWEARGAVRSCSEAASSFCELVLLRLGTRVLQSTSLCPGTNALDRINGVVDNSSHTM